MMLLTYFNSLPDVVIEEIVRNISARPRHHHWKAYLRENDAFHLVAVSSPLRDAAAGILTHLTATNDNFARGSVDTLVVRGAARGLPALLAHSLSEVHLRAVPLDASWVRQLASRCEALVSLEVHYAMPSPPFVRLLRTRGEKLKSLSAWFVGSREHLDAISSYCPFLQKLELQYLRRSSPSLWRAIGGSLKSLTLSFSIALRPTGTLEHVQGSCRNLTELSVLENYHGFDLQVSRSVANLYSSFGNQLESASLQDVDPSMCSEVRRSCPRLQCSAGHMHKVVEQMNELGNLINELRIDFHGDTYNHWETDTFYKAAAQCEMVEKVWTRSSLLMCTWSHDFFQVFFDRPKPSIKVFYWTEVISENFCEEALRLLSLRTCGLVDVSLSFSGFQSLDFSALVSKNRNIRKITIHFARATFEDETSIENADRVFLDLVTSFMSLSDIKHICITVDGDTSLLSALRQKRQRLRNEFAKYRNRNVFLIIAGVEYLS